MRAIAALALTAASAGVVSVVASPLLGGSNSSSTTTPSSSTSSLIIGIGSENGSGHGSHRNVGNSSSGVHANATLLDADHLPLQLTTAKVDNLDIEIDIQLLTNGYDGTTVSGAGDEPGRARGLAGSIVFMWLRTRHSLGFGFSFGFAFMSDAQLVKYAALGEKLSKESIKMGIKMLQ